MMLSNRNFEQWTNVMGRGAFADSLVLSPHNLHVQPQSPFQMIGVGTFELMNFVQQIDRQTACKGFCFELGIFRNSGDTILNSFHFGCLGGLSFPETCRGQISNSHFVVTV